MESLNFPYGQALVEVQEILETASHGLFAESLTRRSRGDDAAASALCGLCDDLHAIERRIAKHMQ